MQRRQYFYQIYPHIHKTSFGEDEYEQSDELISQFDGVSLLEGHV